MVANDEAAGRKEIATERVIEELFQQLPPELRYRAEAIPDNLNAAVLWSQSDLPEFPTTYKLQTFLGEDAVDSIIYGGAPFPEGDDGEFVRDWLVEQESLLKVIDAGIDLARFRQKTEDDALMSPFMIASRGVLLKCLHAKRLVAEGQYEAARDNVLDMLTVGRMCGTEYLINFYIGTDLQMRALETMRWVASRSDFHRETISDFTAAVRRPPDKKSAPDEVLKSELCQFFVPFLAGTPETADGEEFLETLKELYYSFGDDEEARAVRSSVARLLEGHRRPLDRKATLRLFADHYLRYLPDLTRPWRDQGADVVVDRRLEADLRAWPEDLRPGWAGDVTTDPEALERSRRALHAIENPLGKAIALTYFQSSKDDPFDFSFNPPRLVELWFTLLAEREATRAYLAIRRHTLLEGRLPADLGVLVDGKVLDSLPIDPFSGRPFQYSPERRLIWSVGPDGHDDGGTPKPEDPDEEDGDGSRSEAEADPQYWDIVYSLDWPD